MHRLTGTLAMLGVAAAAKPANMNGEYAVSSRGDIDTPWNSDYASKGYEYFDVWAPEIATHYGEVFWTDQGTTPIPPEIVKRFEGKVIAIQGYEQDQVMVSPVGKPGLNPEKDVSVPINWAYNHHYCAWMGGKHSERKEIETPGDVYGSGAHGQKTIMASVDKADQSGRKFGDVASTNWFISEGNGGESRKSFHGYPQGFAQLIESPQNWHITPMQIDTRNREHGAQPTDVHKCMNFSGVGENGKPCAGYEPRQARYGRDWAGITGSPPNPGHYSGVLECPCNGRFGGDPLFYPGQGTKKLTRGFTAIPSGACTQGQHFKNAQQCYDAVAALGFKASKIGNKTASDKSMAAGCVLVTNADGSADAVFNTGGAPDSACAKYTSKAALSTSPTTKVTLSISLAESKTATISLKGPADRWFAVGLGAKIMFDQPYTLVVNSSGVVERKLGTCGTEANHCAGTLLAPSVKLVSNTVVDGVRTVVLTRPFAGLTKDHMTFDTASASTMNYISANGGGAGAQAFAYHGVSNHDSLTLSFAPAAGTTCVCDLGESGELCWNPAVVNGSGSWGAPTSGAGCDNFKKGCVARYPAEGTAGTAPSGDLLFQRNPTCNSGQYAGGLTCCKHKRIMLDADQPIQDELLRYHMKFRFWFQEYVPTNTSTSTKASHQNLQRIYWTTEANAGEYDIPPAFYTEGQPKIVGYPELGVYPELTPGSSCTGNCPHGDDCECVHTITYNNSVGEAMRGQPMRLIYAGGHCHAPACIGIWLYRNDPGHEMELLCHQAPIYGNGTGVASKAGIYDEEGYLALPPCLWADEAGLHPSFLLPANTSLVSIKRNRNTHDGHFGEMASWQMRGVTV